jgi:hypothetical protein
MAIDGVDVVRALAQAADASLGKVLVHPHFYVLFTQWDPIIGRFVVEHFDEIFARAFELAEPYDKRLTCICLRIVRTGSAIARPRIFADTNLEGLVRDYLRNFAKYSFRSQESYMGELDGLVFLDGGRRVAPAFDHDYDFFRLLFNPSMIESESVFGFLSKTLFYEGLKPI